jgi:hypothetical protein
MADLHPLTGLDSGTALVVSTPPTPPAGPAAASSRSRFGGCLALVGGFAAGAVITLAVLAGLRAANPAGSFWSALRGVTHLDMSQPTVVQKIQQLQRLETVVYTMDKVVSGGHESEILPDFLGADRILMLVHGESVAGVDFSRLRTDDVRIEGKRLILHLPASQIFSTHLDSTKTRVYSRQTGWLVPTDPDLETKVRAEGERQIQQAALAEGILKTADQNARSTLTSLLHGLGFSEVEFQ